MVCRFVRKSGIHMSPQIEGHLEMLLYWLILLSIRNKTQNAPPYFREIENHRYCSREHKHEYP